MTEAALDLQPPTDNQPADEATADSQPADDATADSQPTDDQWATPDDRRDAARDAYRHSLQAGAPLSGAELGRRYGRSQQWGRQLAAQVRAETRRDRSGAATSDGRGDQRRHSGASPEPGGDMAAPTVPAGVRRVTTVAVTAVAGVAATVSFEHQRLLATYAGEAWRAWLFPLSVDGLVLAASMTMLTRRRTGQPAGPLAWTALLIGLGTSLAGNVIAAAPGLIDPTLTRQVVAAWPPLALALAWELLLQQHRPPT